MYPDPLNLSQSTKPLDMNLLTPLVYPSCDIFLRFLSLLSHFFANYKSCSIYLAVSCPVHPNTERPYLDMERKPRLGLSDLPQAMVSSESKICNWPMAKYHLLKCKSHNHSNMIKESYLILHGSRHISDSRDALEQDLKQFFRDFSTLKNWIMI